MGSARRLVDAGWRASFRLIAATAYIHADDPHLAQGDLRHEPPSALASGADGLDAIRTIIAGAQAHLVPAGWLLLEHGWTQAAAVRGLLEGAGFAEVSTQRDLEGRDRVSLGRSTGQAWPVMSTEGGHPDTERGPARSE